jgi:hypothetical protein
LFIQIVSQVVESIAVLDIGNKFCHQSLEYFRSNNFQLQSAFLVQETVIVPLLKLHHAGEIFVISHALQIQSSAA